MRALILGGYRCKGTMSDEGGTWSSDEGQRWDSSFTDLGEDDLKKDLHRREEWSDISDDESPAVYADISHSTAYQYNAIQPKGTVWDSSYLSYESSVAVHGTPAAFSFPFHQDGVFWGQQQQVVLPEVASGSTEYPVAPYPSVSYPSALYPSAIYQMMEEKTMACSLDEGRKMEEEDKKKSRNLSFIEQTVADERHKEDPPKDSCHLGSELEGKEPVISSLASGPSSNIESLETTASGHLSLEEPHAPNSCSSGQKHNYLDPVMLPESKASMFHRERQCESTVESGHSGSTTSRERGESAVTVFASTSEFSLDRCHKGGTAIPSEPFASHQCEANPVCKNSSEPLAKEIGMSSPLESPPNECDEKRAIMADQHRGTLEELSLDISGQDATNINTSEVTQHPALAEIDNVKAGGSTQLGMGLTRILKKQKRKAGRPFKKKTLLKMSKLLELVKECEKDAKDPHVNEAADVPLKHLVKSDMQRPNALLNSPNDKSLPCTSSIPSEVKEYIHSLSISPLPKRPIQVPKAPSLIALSGNSNQYEDCMERPKKCVQATQFKGKSHKKALCKLQRTQGTSVFSVPQDPKSVPETVLARKTRQSASHRLKSIRKTRKKKVDMNTEKWSTSSQSNSVTSSHKPVNLPVVGDVSAIKRSSKLSSKAVVKASTRSSAKKSSKKRDGNISKNMELRNTPLMPARVELTEKRRKKISVKSRKAGPQTCLQPNSAAPHIIFPQKDHENTIAMKGKIKNENKLSRAKSATPKGKKTVKGYVADTQNKSELLCEVMDANELQAEMIDNSEGVPIETQTSVQKDFKRKEKAKRKGTPKRSNNPNNRTQNNPDVLPSMTDETVLPETLSESSLKPFKKAPKRNAKTASKKMPAIEEKGQNDMGQIEPNGLPLEKDATCSKEDLSVYISQPPPREKKTRKRKATEDGENGHQNQNNCSVDQVPNSSRVTLNESDHCSTQPKSAKRWSNIEPTPKTHRYRHPKKETKNVLGASQPVLTENVLLHTDSEKLTSQVPENSLFKQMKSHKKRVSDLKEDGKLPEVNINTTLHGKCIVSSPKSPQTPKGSSFKKKVRVPKVQPASQDNSLDMSTETSLLKTSTPRKVKKGEMTVPKKEQVQLSIVNRSFDFTEEEFHVPVIKVTSRKDVPLEVTTPKQSCGKMSKRNSERVKRARTGATKSETSQEPNEFISTKTFSELPEIKPEPLAMPLSATKPVKKTNKQKTPKSSLEQLVVGHSDSQKLRENSSVNKVDEKVDGKCTEIKIEQAEFALSAVDMGHPAGLQQSSMQTTDYVAMLKRKPGRPFKKKTLLRMAKILEIVQETESSSTDNGGITNYVEGVLPKKQHQPRVEREKVKALVTPTRRSLRTVLPVKSESSLHPLSKISMDTDHEENTDASCSSTLNRLSSPDKCFTNTIALDSNDASVDYTDQQDPQKVTEVESTAVRALKKRKKRKVFNPKKKKMRWRKLCQQLANVTATQQAALLSNTQGGACVSTNIDVSCKVSSLPLSCKEEELEHAILHKPNTSKTESGTPLQTLKTPLSGSKSKTQKKGKTGDLQTLRAHQTSRICSTKKQDDIEGFLVQMGVDGQSYDRDSDVRVHCRDCCKSSGEEKACSGPLTDIWISQETEEASLLSQEPDSPEHMDEQTFISPDKSPVHPHPLETFLSEESLNTHQCENHRPRRTLRCEVCGKGFSSLRNWVKHSLLHNGRSSHSCLLCYQSFTNNRALQIHLKMHNNDLRFPTSEIPSEPLLFPHQCWHCNASFSSGELLYAHQICHAVGGKPPARPKGAPTGQRTTNDVSRTLPQPTVPESPSVLVPAVEEKAPVPEITDESLFHYAHPDSLYVALQLAILGMNQL
ncbi:uncharacterized protein LOC125285637 [Alosa alosa]|uniref:uncharacterized protein LOC125285637 n=1 Tax=Alosa alosa TaxID=278164 RepID=UPI0020153643|nr:uncharacterized protein LOC125285637 [Alosa alosa]